MKLSVVVPCYNESENIKNTFQSLQEVLGKITPDHEILFVDNGGTDNQLDIMKKIYTQNKKYVKIISLSRNFGYQISLTAGIESAQGDAVVLIDADLQDPPEMIHDFVKKWREGYDVVYGVRKKRKGSLIYRAYYKIFYRLLNFTSDIKIPLDAGEFALLSKRVIQEINQMPEQTRFIRGLRVWVGFKQLGIPYERYIRKKGKSKFNFFQNYTLALDGIISFSTRILSSLLLLGFFMILTAFSILLYTIFAKYLFQINVAGYTSIMVVISFFSGINIFILGIIGSVLERVLLEVKARPKYIVKESFGVKK